MKGESYCGAKWEQLALGTCSFSIYRANKMLLRKSIFHASMHVLYGCETHMGTQVQLHFRFFILTIGNDL